MHPDFYLYEHSLYVESRQFKEQVYERLARRRGLQVLHLEAGDVEKVRTATDDNRGIR
jgi:hypothetical protein